MAAGVGGASSIASQIANAQTDAATAQATLENSATTVEKLRQQTQNKKDEFKIEQANWAAGVMDRIRF